MEVGVIEAEHYSKNIEQKPPTTRAYTKKCPSTGRARCVSGTDSIIPRMSFPLTAKFKR